MMVNVHEAKTNFSKLLELAHAGQKIILAKSGKPYALWEHYVFLTTRYGTVPKPGTVPLRAVSLRAGSRAKA